MDLIFATSETKVITTHAYAIDQADPLYAYYEEEKTEFVGKKSTRSRLVKAIEDKHFEHHHPYLVTPEFFSRIRTEDPFQVNDIIKTCVFEKVDRDVVNNKDNELVWLSFWDHTVLSHDLLPLPFCRNYDYIGTYFSNEFIHLSDDFLEWLRDHPWVVNKKDIKVKSIPYYNAESDRDLYVQVSICPSVEAYREMVQYVKDNPGRHLSLHNLISSSPYNPKEVPDWFGIKPWVK